MTAIMAFASVGALLIQPTLASAATNKSVFSDSTSNNSSGNTADIATASLSCGQVIKKRKIISKS